MSYIFKNMMRRGCASVLGLDPTKFTWAQDYSHVLIPWSGIMISVSTGEEATSAKKGQRMILIPATDITRHDGKERLIVQVNPRLHEVAAVSSSMFLVEQALGDTFRASLSVTFRENSSLEGLDYLIRAYGLLE